MQWTTTNVLRDIDKGLSQDFAKWSSLATTICSLISGTFQEEKKEKSFKKLDDKKSLIFYQ